MRDREARGAGSELWERCVDVGDGGDEAGRRKAPGVAGREGADGGGVLPGGGCARAGRNSRQGDQARHARQYAGQSAVGRRLKGWTDRLSSTVRTTPVPPGSSRNGIGHGARQAELDFDT